MNSTSWSAKHDVDPSPFWMIAAEQGRISHRAISNQPGANVVGGDEVGKIATQVVAAFVLEALDTRIFDGGVHAFDLAVDSRMLWLCGSMFCIVLGAALFEGISPLFAVATLLHERLACSRQCMRSARVCTSGG
jgi:hypothetical protein